MVSTASDIEESSRRLTFREIPPDAIPDFRSSFGVIDDLLPVETFETLRRFALALADVIERSYVLGHKQGGTVAHDRLRRYAPEIVSFYQSAYLRDLITAIVGERVLPTPAWDQSSCSVLIYSRAGDHIGWHYDYNFYRGRHFTVLLSAENLGSRPGQLSSAVLEVRSEGRVSQVSTPSNTLALFEGARVLHRVTPLGSGERRIAISMTFGTNPTSPFYKDLARRVKDTAYFGARALWA